MLQPSKPHFVGVGTVMGAFAGDLVIALVGVFVGTLVGVLVRALVGAFVGALVGAFVWAPLLMAATVIPGRLQLVVFSKKFISALESTSIDNPTGAGNPCLSIHLTLATLPDWEAKHCSCS